MKKAITLLLALVMCLSICACTNGAGKNEVDIYEATNNKFYSTEKDYHAPKAVASLNLSFSSEPGEYKLYMLKVGNGNISLDPGNIHIGTFEIEGNTVILDGEGVLTYDPEEKTFTHSNGTIFYYQPEAK